jgi:hypothetical protein|tara:strand:- start:158 stop:463 length:306 start_codon:yes stop_codon:yes gene_type:complete
MLSFKHHLTEAVKLPKWKKAGSDGEKEIQFPTRRFRIEKFYESSWDGGIKHKGEWEIFEWDKRTKTFPPSGGDIWSPQWYAKQKVMERGKYDNKGKKIEGV